MAGVTPAGPFPIPGVNFETWLVRFDKAGVCTSPETRAALLVALAAKPNSPILFFSHGWNNDFSDAVALYKKFLSCLQDVLQASALPGPAPIFVGVTWPSIWLPSDSGPELAGADPAGKAETESVAKELRDILPQDTNWDRLHQLIHALQLSQAEASELAALLKPAIQPDNVGAEEAAVSENKIVEAMNALQASQGGPPARDNLDDIGTVKGAGVTAEPGTAGFFSFLDPRWAVRLASLYIMKDRAGTVGTKGVAPLLRDIQQNTQAPLHIIGHSFGAKVMLSAIAAQAAGGPRARSLLLLQPAVSHLSFAASVPGRPGPGGYRSVLDRVVNPIVATYSTHDAPLHTIYHLALLRREDLGDLQIAAGETTAGNPPNAYAALGGYGPRGAGERLLDTIPGPGEAIDLAGRRIIGLDGSRANRIDSHGGVATPFTAWTLRALMALP